MTQLPETSACEKGSAPQSRLVRRPSLTVGVATSVAKTSVVASKKGGETQTVFVLHRSSPFEGLGVRVCCLQNTHRGKRYSCHAQGRC